MNGGYSSRACVGLAPAEGGLGAHLSVDVRRMLAGRAALLDNYPDYFRTESGIALTWLAAWDGTDSLELRVLDPYFIEICRRVRLVPDDGRLAARTAPSRAPRIYAKMAGGNLGDFWTPVRIADNKALSLSQIGFRYDRLKELVLDERTFVRPPAMHVENNEGERWRLVARGVAAGQGKTEGYHERTDISFSSTTARALSRKDEGDKLAEFAQAQIDEVADVMKALRFGIAIAAEAEGTPTSFPGRIGVMPARMFAVSTLRWMQVSSRLWKIVSQPPDLPTPIQRFRPAALFSRGL